MYVSGPFRNSGHGSGCKISSHGGKCILAAPPETLVVLGVQYKLGNTGLTSVLLLLRNASASSTNSSTPRLRQMNQEIRP